MLNTRSIITVPAVGAEQFSTTAHVEDSKAPEKTGCRGGGKETDWLKNAISKFNDPKPKISQYKHPKLQNDTVLEKLAEHLLSWLSNKQRQSILAPVERGIQQLQQRATFFMCHSTGGLVVKKVTNSVRLLESQLIKT
jgi:hypothetical protein